MLRPITEAVNDSPVSFGYDADSLLNKAGMLIIHRDTASGRVDGTTLGLLSDHYDYSQYGDVVGYAVAYGGSPLIAAGYERDDSGRIVSIGARNFEFDDAGRLARVSIDSTPVSEYAYDANGNRLAHRFIGGTAQADYDAQDRLLTYGDTSYAYHGGGDLESRTTGNEITTFEYDAFGNLRRARMPGKDIEYVVDGQNRRVGKRTDGTLMQAWLYADQLRIVAELDGANNVVTRFVYGSRTNVPDYMIRAGITYRIISDHLGSPQLVINVTDGTVVETITRDEFGRVLSDTAPGFQPFGFAGGLYDYDTGLVRFGARDYDPQTGRFVSKDPIGFSGGSANLYAYSFNDPINFADPSGMLTVPFVGWVDVGETAGSAALEQWADHMTDPNTAGIDLIGSYIGGFFAALWTPCTSDKTFTTLAAAYGANAYVGRPFYQYYPANNAAYNSRYLTRGGGWKPPYSTGPQAAERLSLPPWNQGTAVRQVPNRWDQFIGGPRVVVPKFGQSGGGTEYLIGGWPK